MLLRKKTKENPIKGCALSLLTLVGLLAVCFVACLVLFQLNQATTSASSSGGIFAIFFH